MKEISINSRSKKSIVVMVDDLDYESLSKFRWTICNRYPVRIEYYNGKRVRSIYMHREILNCPIGLEVDHINGDPLDNQRNNLRTCTHLENSRNRKISKNNKLGVKGVYFDKKLKRYLAEIKVNNKTIKLGRFRDLLSAAKTYNKAASHYFGEFAHLNVI